jgi:hypothetical protein
VAGTVSPIFTTSSPAIFQQRRVDVLVSCRRRPSKSPRSSSSMNCSILLFTALPLTLVALNPASY